MEEENNRGTEEKKRRGSASRTREGGPKDRKGERKKKRRGLHDDSVPPKGNRKAQRQKKGGGTPRGRGCASVRPWLVGAPGREAASAPTGLHRRSSPKERRAKVGKEHAHTHAHARAHPIRTDSPLPVSSAPQRTRRKEQEEEEGGGGENNPISSPDTHRCVHLCRVRALSLWASFFFSFFPSPVALSVGPFRVPVAAAILGAAAVRSPPLLCVRARPSPRPRRRSSPQIRNPCAR